MMVYYMTPDRIKSIRKRLGLGVDEFAALLGLTGAHRGRTVFRWERGQCKPTSAKLTKLDSIIKALEKIS